MMYKFSKSARSYEEPRAYARGFFSLFLSPTSPRSARKTLIHGLTPVVFDFKSDKRRVFGKKYCLSVVVDMTLNNMKIENQAGHYEFEAIFTPQPEGGFTVEVPDLPGCISEGDTLEEAEKNIQEAIELYLETLEERGIPLPHRESSRMFKMNITVVRLNQTRKTHA